MTLRLHLAGRRARRRWGSGCDVGTRRGGRHDNRQAGRNTSGKENGKEKSSQPSHGGGPSRHQGTELHGWAPDVDGTRRQDNPSARRSFHTDEHAPPSGKGRRKSGQERGSVPGDTAERGAKSGEEHGDDAEKGMRDTGRRGRSRRPSGTRDDSASTGVDPGTDKDRRRPG
ncbi:hypothetical protein [Streptomyces sp. NPDC050388]|uniref:hypothetical protein n=1 Tax=Streptomyces sp. NPDC050388 TaxID=3155781 RepID=UPI00343436CB